MRCWTLVLLLLTLVTCLHGRQPRSPALTKRSFKLSSVLRENQRKLLTRASSSGQPTAAALQSVVHRKRFAQKDYLDTLKQINKLSKRKHKRDKKKKPKKRKHLLSRKDACHFRSLRRCGKKVIKNLSSPPGFNKRCATKERFLDCMSGMQRRKCTARGRGRHGPGRRMVRRYRRRLQTLLNTTRGCVIGVDILQNSVS